MIRKIFAQALKEWRLFRRDKLLIALAAVMPIALMSLAGLTSSLRLRNVKLLVYDYDNTPLSRTYLETYGAAITFILVPHGPDESPEFALASGRGRAALIIPQNFERDARSGAAPVVQLMIDATDSNAATSLGKWPRHQRNLRAEAVLVPPMPRLFLKPPLVQSRPFQSRLLWNRRSGNDAHHFPCPARCPGHRERV
jgi:hypothetical protein